MRRLTLLGAATAACVLAVAAGPHAARAAPPLQVAGSPTAAPLVADLAYFYRRATPTAPAITILASGTDAAVADVSRGLTDLGLASRDRSADDPSGLVFTPFARSGLCLVTNNANKVPNLTRAQIAQLVDGQATDWSQVAGATVTGPITPAGLVPGTGGDAVFLDRFVDLTTPILARPRTFATARQIRDFVAATPGAWGDVDLAFATGVHRVPYEGVACTRATIVDGSYHGAYDLAFMTRGTPRGAVARFLRWVRTSPTARRVIAVRRVPIGTAR
jgi:phosphate transport system substrate-binding protein